MTTKTEAAIVQEDIKKLADDLKDHIHQFEGSSFLITGAGGFLGNYMVLLLKYLNDNVLEKPAKGIFLDNFATGYEREVVEDENLQFVQHSVIEPFETDIPIDYVLHMAGIASPLYYTKFPIETMDVTTIGSRNMLELATKHKVKSFLFTSSSEVYGDPAPEFVPTPETYNGNVSITGPRAVYDESKRFAEILCVSFFRVHQLPVKIVRYFNVFGPGIRPNDYRVLPNFIERAIRNEPLEVHGDGLNTRSYCYINDGIEATFKVLFSDMNGEAVNIGNPALEISVKGLAEKVAEVYDGEVAINYIPPPHAVYADSDPKRRCPDITKIKEAIGWEPKYSLEEGLARTIAWYQSVMKD
ncbi:MAG: NAD-dependent epimerase/dehydratase family protein [Bacteroidetes bacterium]|nr:NAD-dependent epimerase/dehydratase family protein [Bacteroidota bacterium]